MEHYCPFKIREEGEDVVARFNCEHCKYVPSIEDNSYCMQSVFNVILKNDTITKVVLTQRREYEYDKIQVNYIKEIVKLYKYFVYNRSLFELRFDNRILNNYYVRFKKIIYHTIKSDPIGAYVELKRLRRELIILKDKSSEALGKTIKEFIKIIDEAKTLFESTKLISIAQPYLPGYNPSSRSAYSHIFNPMIKPDFMFTKVMATYPTEGEIIDSYILEEDTEVTIFEVPENVMYLYHIVPPELKLSEEKYSILDKARVILSEHQPRRSEFVDPKRIRDIFFHIGRDLIEEISHYENVKLTQKEIEKLANILVRYTVGFGLIEVLLSDENIQDITINSPQGRTQVFINHAIHGECFTNITPTTSDAESWASKLRLISGRPLDEANPVLDTEIEVPYARARVAAVSPPLNPTGLAFALRRHRNKPWTLPLFIKNKMLNPLAAGLLSFLIDGSRTFLVAGTRSAGKTSLLGAMMIEVMRKYRIITIEDTLELPTDYLRNIGYNIQPLKVASALTKGSSELSAEEGLRTTLRLGDSCLFVGEVRSTEARALYEAMRVGALANVVAGTIHGDSPYGVYDRVVNDLKVPKTSFKATDIIIVANPVRSPDGLKKFRRVTQITEVRKHWEEDPLLEHGFVDLMKYNSEKDGLEISDNLINGDSEVIKSIGSRVKEWVGNWDAIWDNIVLRAKIKEELVKVSDKLKKPQLLEAEFVVKCNDAFHKISEKVKEELGSLDSEEIFNRWKSWLNREIKSKNNENEL